MRRYLTIISTVAVSLMLSSVSFAEEAAAATHTSENTKVFLAIASGFAIAFAAFAGCLGQSKAATAALDGIARNPGAAPKIQTPMIIALALIESLVIYAFVMAILLWTKI